MAVPEEAVVALTAYCDARTPGDLQDTMRVEVTVSGNSLIVWDCRAPWSGTGIDRMECAKITWSPELGTYSMRWPKADGGWHPYPQLPPCGRFERILQELDEDPDCCFWG